MGKKKHYHCSNTHKTKRSMHAIKFTPTHTQQKVPIKRYNLEMHNTKKTASATSVLKSHLFKTYMLPEL